MSGCIRSRAASGDTHARRGFSLVEVLVSLGIVAVLLAIMLPALAAARESARESRCVSNLRSLGVAVQLYRDRNDGVFPDAHAFPLRPTGQHGAVPLLSPFLSGPEPQFDSGGVVRTFEPWRCPSDRGPGLADVVGTSYEYMYFWYRYAHTQSLGSDGHRRISLQAENDSRAEIFVDGLRDSAGANDGEQAWHRNGRRHALFADGRVEARPPVPEN